MACVLVMNTASKALEKWEEERESTGHQLQESWREWLSRRAQGGFMPFPRAALFLHVALLLSCAFLVASGGLLVNCGMLDLGTEGPASVVGRPTLCVFLNM